MIKNIGKAKVKAKGGTEIDLDSKVFRTNDHLHVVETTAVWGGSKTTKRLTIGAVDGSRPLLKKGDIQKFVDIFHQELADDVEFKETVRLAFEEET